MESTDSGRDRGKMPFELDKDLSLSRGSSQEYRGVSKSLQPVADPTIPPARYSLDQEASSLDSSLLDGQEVPMDTSEDSVKPTDEPVTVVSARQELQSSFEPHLFIQEERTSRETEAQTAGSAILMDFEVSCRQNLLVKLSSGKEAEGLRLVGAWGAYIRSKTAAR